MRLAPALVACVLALAFPRPARAAARPNVILIVVDALRADHLGAYGYGRATSPRLDAMGAGGTVFTQAIAQASWTLPALSSLMTSLYPSAHGAVEKPPKRADDGRFVLGPAQRLNPRLPTLAEAFRRGGYRTIGVVDSAYCRPVFGLPRGFDEYVDQGGRFEQLNALALRRLKAGRDKPFFLYLHVMDVHPPYGGPPAGRDRWSPGYAGKIDDSSATLDALVDGRIALDEDVERRLIALYDAGISYTDEQLGGLLRALDELGLSSSTVVAVTADHGEQLFDHGGLGHGDTLFDEVLHVPLVLRGPGVPAGARVSSQVRQIDIAPTLLDLAGLPPLARGQGVSLRPWLDGRRTEDLPAFSEVRAGGSGLSLRSWREPPWKLIAGSQGTRLYDLRADPGERRDVSAREKGVARKLLSELEALDAASAPRPNVLLVVVDALRADHLGVYGYHRATSPKLDALAAEGAVFTQVIAQASWTLPALSSLMTSLYPSVHGAVVPPAGMDWIEELNAGRFTPAAGDRLPAGLPTLAEGFRRGGYRTLGAVQGGFCRSTFGFGRGFDQYFNRAGRIEKLNRLVVPWLEAHRDRPFFVYLHVLDVHDPYGGPPASRDRWSPGYSGPLDGAKDSLRALEKGRLKLDAQAKRRVVALYDAGISYTDENLGALLRELDRLGLSSSTIVAVTADHGEQLGERGGFHHGDSLFDELLHVPLILRGPGIPAGARLTAQARQIDIAPTLLDLAGLPPLPTAQGVSLKPWLDGRPPRDLPAFSEVHDLQSLRTPAWKLIVRPGGEWLYDLRADPGERRDVSAREPAVARDLSARLKALSGAASDLRARLDPERTAARLDAQTREALRAEGYLK